MNFPTKEYRISCASGSPCRQLTGTPCPGLQRPQRPRRKSAGHMAKTQLPRGPRPGTTGRLYSKGHMVHVVVACPLPSSSAAGAPPCDGASCRAAFDDLPMREESMPRPLPPDECSSRTPPKPIEECQKLSAVAHGQRQWGKAPAWHQVLLKAITHCTRVKPYVHGPVGPSTCMTKPDKWRVLQAEVLHSRGQNLLQPSLHCKELLLHKASLRRHSRLKTWNAYPKLPVRSALPRLHRLNLTQFVQGLELLALSSQRLTWKAVIGHGFCRVYCAFGLPSPSAAGSISSAVNVAGSAI